MRIRHSARSLRAFVFTAGCGVVPAVEAQTPSFQTSAGSLTSITYGGQTIQAGELENGFSVGESEALAQGAGVIGTADDLDLKSYFARNNGVPPEWDIFLTTWLDGDPGFPDFFVFDVGGNDDLQAAALFADGSIGQPVDITSDWIPTGVKVTSGPNGGQFVFARHFSVTDLLTAAGAPLSAETIVSGVRVLSSTVDGAVFLATESAPLPLGPPVFTTSKFSIPANDDFQTVVTLQANSSVVASPPVNYEYEWIAPGAVYVGGTGPTDQTIRVTFPGDDPPQVEVRMSLPGVPGLVEKSVFDLGLWLGPPAYLHGEARVWGGCELWYSGPPASMLDDAPNPFLDYRLDVTMQRPDGSTFVIPGFFDGDGVGGSEGDIYKVRFRPDQAGLWRASASFVQGTDIAVAADIAGGTPLGPDGIVAMFEVGPPSLLATGFERWGPLQYVDEHYLKFQGGPYFLKGGTNSPENLLAFSGFADVEDQGGDGIIHSYQPHLGDWSIEDPVLPLNEGPDSRALIGALNYLASVGVNSIYFLPMNLGGDAQDTVPFVGYQNTVYDKTHYHVTRLAQWERVFRHASSLGILLHIVLAETEPANENWLDGGGLGTERRLFFRELVARFAHHPGIKWNLCEENDFSPSELQAMAQVIRDLDPWDHPIAFHNRTGDFSDYNALLGDPLFDAMSIQYELDQADANVESWRTKSAQAGRPWIVEMDENSPPDIGLSDSNTEDLRKRVLWDVYLSGGQVEWYFGDHPLPLGGDHDVEDFRTREEMWDAMRYARTFVQSLPFWEMEPNDGLVTNESQDYGGAEVFALEGELYAIYYPRATSTGQLNLITAPGAFDLRWYNPRTGEFEGSTTTVFGGSQVALGAPPSSSGQDWVALVEQRSLTASDTAVSVSQGGAVTLQLDAGAVHGGAPYLLLGSASGDAPGLVLGPGVTLPLASDFYFQLTLATVGGPFVPDAFGFFGPTGQSNATFFLPPGLPAELVGVRFYHAFGAGWDLAQFASNAVSVTLLP